MKVGTDGVLLGAWVPVKDAQYVLDIGTGCGLVALMIAQRTSSAQIDAVEIEEASYHEAVLNAANSPWSHRLSIYHGAIQDFNPDRRYDLIVSNPPFFRNSLKSPVASRNTARHTESLSHNALLENAARLLTPQGRLCVILPDREGLEFVARARDYGLFCLSQLEVRSREQSNLERRLLELTRMQPPSMETGEMYLYGAANERSVAYETLTRNFYLPGGNDGYRS